MMIIILIMRLWVCQQAKFIPFLTKMMQLTLSQIRLNKENKGKLTMQVLTIDENGKLDISVRQGLMEAREIS